MSMPISSTQSTEGYWTERHLLQLQCSELQRRQPEAGRALRQGTPTWTPCAFVLPLHLLLSMLHGPLFWLTVDAFTYNLSKKGSLKMKLCCVLGTSDRSSVEKLVLQQLSLFSSPHKKRLFPNPTIFSYMLRRKSHCYLHYSQQRWSYLEANRCISATI